MLKRVENAKADGEEILALMTRLFPICRSMTGDGVRQSLEILSEYAPVTIHEVPSGTRVLDWQVPQEWNVRDAFVKDAEGNRIIDFRCSNLHLVNGSKPIHQTMDWKSLKEKLYTLPDRPGSVPYRTCFHREDWGFCITQDQFDQMAGKPNAQYEVMIDSDIREGFLTYGEIVIPGMSDREILLSAHICHPSLANDNLSGLAIAVLLARSLMAKGRNRHTVRIVMAPATIGAITWLAQNQSSVERIDHGLVLSLLGDPGPLTYKKSRRGNAVIDRAAQMVLSGMTGATARDFEPFGYDERQYCSPGFNLPMGCLMRTPSGEFPEYHTSDDNLEFVSRYSLQDSYETVLAVVNAIEGNKTYLNMKPHGEPRLGKHGLYESFPPEEDMVRFQQAVQWVLNMSDGNHALLDIAERSGFNFEMLRKAADRLEECGLIKPSN